MSSVFSVEGLTFYEARAVLMFVEVHNSCSVLNSKGKFQIEKVQWHTGGRYSITVESDDPIGKELIENELHDIRANGYSMVDPALVDHEKIVSAISALAH